jgi:phosphatidate cytidylyltransferase
MVPAIGMLLVFFPFASPSDQIPFPLCGMLFGKHKLAPVSVLKKTVEGAIGGLVGGVLGTALMMAVGSYILRTPFGTLGSGGIWPAWLCDQPDRGFELSVIKREYA